MDKQLLDKSPPEVAQPDFCCSSCGKPMRYNVPRLGPDGGFVHAATGSLSCAATTAADARSRTQVAVDNAIEHVNPAVKQLKD